MPDNRRALWDERWRAGREGCTAERGPSPFLVAQGDLLPRHGRALDVAGGAGRNAVWLARQGLEVTLADFSPVALALARRSAAEAGVDLQLAEIDLTAAPLPAGPWDAIVCLYFLWRPLFPMVPRALSPGGLFVFAHATRRNLERHARPGPDHVLEEGELCGLVSGPVSGLEVLRYQEGWLEAGRHEARLVARRPR